MGKTKKTLERKEQVYQLLACLEEKRRDSGNQMQAGVDGGQICATAVLVESLHSQEHAHQCTTALYLGCFQRMS